MTPREKAEYLFNTYFNRKKPMLKDDAKLLAALVAGEVLKIIPMDIGDPESKWEFWQDVKKEIEQL